jgi:hypothetical protein
VHRGCVEDHLFPGGLAERASERQGATHQRVGTHELRDHRLHLRRRGRRGHEWSDARLLGRRQADPEVEAERLRDFVGEERAEALATDPAHELTS